MDVCVSPDAATALSALRSICEDDSARHADRIAAAKLLLEYDRRAEPGDDESVLRVVMDVPREFCV